MSDKNTMFKFNSSCAAEDYAENMNRIVRTLDGRDCKIEFYVKSIPADNRWEVWRRESKEEATDGVS